MSHVYLVYNSKYLTAGHHTKIQPWSPTEFVDHTESTIGLFLHFGGIFGDEYDDSEAWSKSWRGHSVGFTTVAGDFNDVLYLKYKYKKL